MRSSAQALVGATQQSQSFVARMVAGGGGSFARAGGSSAGAASGEGDQAHPSLRTKRVGESEWAKGSGDGLAPELAAVTSQSSPEGWTNLINGPGIDSPGRDNNCVDCSRSVESTWRGAPTMSAAMADEHASGTTPYRVTEWSGGKFVAANYDGVNQRLSELGDGASAILVSSWAGGRGGHAYNAINDAGVVKFVDGQSATVSGWPPISWSESQVEATWAVYIDRNGTPL